METISQRELRNDNAKIMRAVEAGQTYTVTRRGVPVASLGPVVNDGGLRCVRPATTRVDFSQLRRVVSESSTEDILADLRGDR